MINIDELTNKISAVVNCAVKFGNEDVSPNEYPLIQIIPDAGIDFLVFTRKGMSVTISFTLKITVSRENERHAFTLLYELLKNINDIDSAIGMVTSDKKTLEEISGTIETEYLDSEYSMSVPMQYKDRINKDN